MRWVWAPDFTPDAGNECPLSAYPEDSCPVRTAMTSALTAAGMPWPITFTSPGLTGQIIVVGAGLAITRRCRGHWRKRTTKERDRRFRPGRSRFETKSP